MPKPEKEFHFVSSEDESESESECEVGSEVGYPNMQLKRNLHLVNLTKTSPLFAICVISRFLCICISFFQ